MRYEPLCVATRMCNYSAVVSRGELPKYWELMYPVLMAVHYLGGSGTRHQIIESAVTSLDLPTEFLEVRYSKGPVVPHRCDWALSYCKMAGTVDNPKRSHYRLTELGHEICMLEESVARDRLWILNREVLAEARARSDARKATER